MKRVAACGLIGKCVKVAERKVWIKVCAINFKEKINDRSYDVQYLSGSCSWLSVCL